MEVLALRDNIDAALRHGQWNAATAGLRDLWAGDNSPAAAGYVVARLEKLRGRIELSPYRLAILRSFTVEPVVPILRAMAFAAGIDLTVFLGDFNAWPQETLDTEGPLYTFQPDATILAVQTRDVAPALWHGESPSAAEESAQRIAAAIRAFRERSTAHLVVHSLECPATSAGGVLDHQAEDGQTSAIHEANRLLRAAARELRGVYMLDYDALVARHGRQAWHDERKWVIARMPIAAPCLAAMAREWMRFLHPLAGKLAKAVAVDLDNTLWGGVVGEDGIAGIQLGAEYPGAAFQNLQRALLDIYNRGILLAVCSKNNPEDAMDALERHPGMLLRPHHFAAMRIDWNPKGANLRAIAAELNIGVDSVAFLDDNPVERQQVREAVPEAIVIELPADPMDYAEVVRDCPYFERLRLSEEDHRRGSLYAAERRRADLERSASTPEDFYRALEQEAEIAPVDAMTLARVAQLTQKTNQFNLTTRRYTEQQIAELAAHPEYQVFSIKVRDRYADNGLVGVGITRDQGEACEIDTFLLSCRVIGRTVETALLAHIAAAARERGKQYLRGWFLPTKKNAPARDFYARHGFAVASQTDAGALWELDLRGALPVWPEWIACAGQATQHA